MTTAGKMNSVNTLVTQVLMLMHSKCSVWIVVQNTSHVLLV